MLPQIASPPYPLTRWHLSEDQIETLRRRLLRRRRQAIEEIERLKEVMHDDSEHLVDDPDRRHLMIEEDHTVTAGMIDREQEAFDAIERALWRMERGTYGFCVETGMPIPLERLEAIPYAERLTEAQEMVDHDHEAPEGGLNQAPPGRR